MKTQQTVKRGFTLVELLTVIAIIAVLAGLLFPVFARMGNEARKRSCGSNVKSIVQAMVMYKDDHGVYPDALYGISYRGGPLEPRLYPHYVKDRSVFTCPNHPQQWKADDTLVQPLQFMNGDMNPGVPAVESHYSTTVDPSRPWALAFARRDSYDIQYRPNTVNGTPYLNYSKYWDGYSKPPTTTGVSPDIGDTARQLIFRNPSDSTVVTVCLYHSDMNAAGQPSTGGMAVVGFLSGRVQDIPADRVSRWVPGNPSATPPVDPIYPWLVSPKP